MEDKSTLLVQVCESITDQKTKDREVTALSGAMEELKIPTGTIITRNEEEQINTTSGKINITPIWRFLLK